MTRVCLPSCSWLAIALSAPLLACGLARAGDQPEAATPSDSREVPPSDFSEETRQAALTELRRTGLVGVEATGALLEFVLNPDTPLDLRCRAVLALGEIGPRNPEQARLLAALLEDPATDGQLRWTLLMTFGEHRFVAPVLRSAILQVATDTSADLILRRQAVFHLRNQGVTPDAAETFAIIVGERDTDAGLRAASLDGLRQATAGTRETLEILGRIAADPSDTSNIRQGAIQVLAALDRESQTVPALTSLVEANNAPVAVRLEAVRSLELLRVSEAEAERLARLIARSDTPPELSRAIARLTSVHRRPLPGGPDDWVPLLAASTQPVEVRGLALDSLLRSASTNAAALTACIDLLRDPTTDPDLHVAATRYLLQRGADAEPARPVLEAIVADARYPAMLREQAGGVLAEIARTWLTAPASQRSSTLADRLRSLESTAAKFEAGDLDTPALRRGLESIGQVQAVLAAEYRSRWWHRSTTWMSRHPAKTAGILVLCLFALVPLATWSWQIVRTQSSTRLPLPPPPQPDNPYAARALDLARQVLLPDNPDRAQSVASLAELGPNAAPAVPLLAQALRDAGHDIDGRCAALKVLSCLQQTALAARPALLSTLDDRSDYLFLRLSSLELLTQVSPDSVTAQLLLERLVDPGESALLRLHSGQALASLPTPPDDYLPRLNTLADASKPGPLRDIAARLRASWTARLEASPQA